MDKSSTNAITGDILNAAIQLFMKKGYVNTSMDEIAETVGMTKGGLYYYVEKKEDLLTGIHDHMIENLINRVNAAVASETDPLKKLSNWIREYTLVVKEYQAHVKIFFTEINHYPKNSFEEMVKRRDLVPKTLREIIIQAIEENKIRSDVNPVVMTFLILGMINWLYIWYRPEGEISIEVIIKNIEKLVFDCIVRRDSDEVINDALKRLTEM